MVDDDVLFRFRLRLFSLAAELGNVRAACRIFGVHPSTYYRWRGPVLRSGLEMLRPRERRPPRMPNQTSQLIEQRVVAFSLGHPGSDRDGSAPRLAQERWGGIVISPNGVWRVLRRHGLNRRISRLSLVAGYAAPPEPERPTAARGAPRRGRPPGRAGRLRLLPRRSPVGHQRAGLAVHRDRSRQLATSGPSWPRRRSTRRPRRRAPWPAGWRPTCAPTAGASSGSSPTTGASSARRSSARRSRELGARQTFIRAGRPATNGAVERVQRTILEECWRPILRPEPGAQADRARPRPRGLSSLLQRGARPHRPADPRHGPRTKP